MGPSKEPGLVVRAYRIKWWWQAFAVAWTAIGLLVWGGILWKEVFGAEEPRPWHFVAASLCIVGGAFWVAHVLQARVTLFVDAIETCGLLGMARLRFDEIRGRREYVLTGGAEEGGDTHYFKVEPNDDRLPTLDSIKDYDFDNEFYSWFKTLSDLDAADKLKNNSRGRA